jgi:hypothetical protein
MPKRKSEDSKKHGDEFQSLIDRATDTASQGQRDESGDPAELQDDDDEDLQNDDADDRRDVGGPS